MNKLIAAVLATLCIAAPALAAESAPGGFLTGGDFRKGNQAMRTAYVIGVLDGFSYAHLFGAPQAKVGKLQTCIGTMHADARQLGELVDRYLDAHHEAWNLQMQPVVLSAMQETCSAHGMALD